MIVSLTEIRYEWMVLLFFFFFQAEDGIRDYKVTGVQTCALPISGRLRSRPHSFGSRRERCRALPGCCPSGPSSRDRKSTRLNSSHLVISYAVFCLKKKNLRSTLYADSLSLRKCDA